MNKKKSRKGRIFLILIVILIAAGGIAAAWYLKQKEEGEVSVGTYKTGTVKKVRSPQESARAVPSRSVQKNRFFP